MVGCETPGPTHPQITQQQFNTLDFGPPLTADYKKAVKQYFSDKLFDPYSAVYDNFSNPQKYWIADPYSSGGKQYVGYIIFLNVNAKNRMGGYVGAKKYGFLFRDNAIIKVMEPEEFGIVE